MIKNKKNLVTENIDVITFSELCNKYNVTSVDEINIDTEGHENIILTQIYSLVSDNKLVANKIKFEYNTLSNKKVIDDTVKKFTNNLGYSIKNSFERWNEDLILFKNPSASEAREEV